MTPHLLLARVPGLPWLLHAAGRLPQDRYSAHRSGAFRAVRYLDLRRPFRFPDATFECVFASHVLEHLEPETAERCLHEIRRVLMPGGVLRLAVPDLDELIASYDPRDPEPFLWGVYQGRGPADRRPHRHWWHYNARSLGTLLEQVGFREIDFPGFRSGRMPDVELVDNRPGSLFAEALK